MRISDWSSDVCSSDLEVKGDVRMRGEPVLVFLVGAQVVQDDVDLPVSGLVGNDLVHEGLKVGPLLGLGGLAADDARGNLQRGEQVDRAVALVGALHALDDLAAAGLHVASRALQGLEGGR